MSLEAWALAALQSLPVYKEDIGSPEKPAQLQMIARSVTEAALEAKGWPLSRKELIAAQIGMLTNETHASLRIHRGECNLEKRECDAAKVKGALVPRALSIFQLHAGALSSPQLWPQLGFMTLESTKLSAVEASRALVRSFRYCAAQRAPGNAIALMYTAVAGRNCYLDRWAGWKPRLDVYERVLRVPVPKAAAAQAESAPRSI